MHKFPALRLFLLASCLSILLLAGCNGEPIGITAATSAPSNTLPTTDPAQKLAEPPKLSGKVVYQSNIVSPSNIFVLDLGTLQTKQLTSDNNSIEPVWSPDGSKIAYACGKNPDSRQICIMDADGTNNKIMTTSAGTKWGADWSPDGKQIAFASSEIPFAHVFILDVDSGKTRRFLPNAPGNEASPKWSPDGQWIAYSSDRKGFNIYMAKSDGTQEKQVSNGNTDDRLFWSKDAKTILFRRIAKESSFFNGNEIMKMNLEKNEVSQITDNTRGDDWPTFSPDEKWIIFASETKESIYQLVVMPAAGGQPAQITKEGILGTAPHWKP